MADMFEGTLPGGSVALSQNGSPLYHYSFLSTFAERCVVPESCCVKIRQDASARGRGARRLRRDDGLRRRRPARPGRAWEHGRRLRRGRRRALGDPRLQARRGARDRGRRPGGLQARDRARPRRDARGRPRRRGRGQALLRELTDGRGADYAFDTAGAPGVVAQAYDAVRRGGMVVAVGIPPVDATADLPGPSLPREEKVVTGSFYGSCRPHVDMPLVIDLYMDGRLDLDALVSRTYGAGRDQRGVRGHERRRGGARGDRLLRFAERTLMGEGFAGSGPSAAHVNTVLGRKGGPVETAWATALATPRQGHIPFVAVLRPNMPVKPRRSSSTRPTSAATGTPSSPGARPRPASRRGCSRRSPTGRSPPARSTT